MKRIILSLALVVGGLTLVPTPAHAQFAGMVNQQRAVQRQVILWFQAYLGRNPTPQELATLTNQYLLTGNPLYVQSVLLASNEFFAKSGGTPQSYLSAVFVTTLGRRPTLQEISALQGPLVFNGRLWFAQAYLSTVARGWQLNTWNAGLTNAVVQPVVVPVVIR